MSDQDAAREMALRALEKRDWPSARLVQHLEKRGITHDTARAAITALLEAGIMDDIALAERAAAMLLRREPLAYRALVERLMRRGFDSATGEHAATAALAEAEIGDHVCRFIRQRLRTTPPRRIVHQLARRGIDIDAIRQAFRDIDAPFPEDESEVFLP